MVDSLPKISIIVPVYNVAEYLPQCLDSLVNQTYPNIEIICVNDGSTDRSGEILNEYTNRYQKLGVISQLNQGLSGARNTGIEIATGDYLMFVDSDDWVDTRICEKLMQAAKTHHADCVMCSYIKEYENHSVINHIFPEDLCWKGNEFREKFYRRLFGPIGEETKRPQDVDLIVSAWMQLFKIDLCRDIRFVDTKKIGTEDCLYQIMVYQNCKSFAYIDLPLYHYRKTNSASLTAKYNPYLYERWQTLYDMMERIIADNGYPELFYSGLNNRILFALIGLGLNEVTAETNNIAKSKRLKRIISADRYQRAFSELDISFMPLPWKMFFSLLKAGMTLPVVQMLELINVMRKRVK